MRLTKDDLVAGYMCPECGADITGADGTLDGGEMSRHDSPCSRYMVSTTLNYVVKTFPNREGNVVHYGPFESYGEAAEWKIRNGGTIVVVFPR